MKVLHRAKTRAIGALLLALTAVVMAGCGGGGASTSSAPGTLRVMLADAPLPNLISVNITIDKVQAHLDGNWVDIETDPVTLNLLDLTTDPVAIASKDLPAGDYNQVRLFISSATVVDDTGTHDVAIGSAAQTGIKININATVNEGEITEILLDFNVAKSLIKQGNGQYRLQPVIPAVIRVLSGTVSGIVEDADGPVQGAEVRAIYKEGSNYAIDTEVNSTLSLSDGTFKIWALLPGTYELQFEHLDGETTLTATVSDVDVSAGQDTSVGTVVVTAP